MEIRRRDFTPYMYRKLIGLTMGRPSNFSFVGEYLAASGWPYGGRSIRWLLSKGVSEVISLTEEPIKESTDFPVYRNLPLANDMPAAPEQLLTISREIKEAVDGGRKVLVHCAAGKGRTGMALASYIRP